MEKRELKIERRMKLEDAILYLTRMLDGAGSEGFSVEGEQESITLAPKPEGQASAREPCTKNGDSGRFHGHHPRSPHQRLDTTGHQVIAPSVENLSRENQRAGVETFNIRR